jgi:hypothetical protein
MKTVSTVFTQAQKKLLKSTYQAERYLGMYRGALAYLRGVNRGPDYFQQNSHFYYETATLDAWVKTTNTFISVKK